MISNSCMPFLICYRSISLDEMPPDFQAELLETDLVILGLAGIKDPLKHGVPEAVNSCKLAGIVVRMVTGDSIEAAIAIAKEANILPATFERPEAGMQGEFNVMEGKAVRERVGGLVQGEREDTGSDYIKNIK